LLMHIVISDLSIALSFQTYDDITINHNDIYLTVDVDKLVVVLVNTVFELSLMKRYWFLKVRVRHINLGK